jgi:L-iditol 2-dehydrogenase
MASRAKIRNATWYDEGRSRHRRGHRNQTPLGESASRVIAIGGPKTRLDLATSWGATIVIDVIDVADVATPRERVQAVRDLTAGRGAEIVLEMSGIPSAFSEGIGMLGKGGRYLIVGQGHNQQIEFNPSLIMFNQATLIGSLSAISFA